MATKLTAAYAMEDYEETKKALTGLLRDLMDFNPCAARSPDPVTQNAGLDQCDRIGICHRGESLQEGEMWHRGDQRERWVGSGLLVAKKY